MVAEKQIEQAVVCETKKMGGRAVKFVSPGWDGVPDRIIFMPRGKMAFVEVKAPGKKMRALQLNRKKTLENLGFRVYCIDNMKMIGGMLHEIQGELH